MLWVIRATDNPVAVVFRVGPRPLCRLSLWHTETDQFEHGQWLKSTVEPRASDLSPDGRYLAIAAVEHRSGGRRYSGHWIAISRPPYFSALCWWWTCPLGSAYFEGPLAVVADGAPWHPTPPVDETPLLVRVDRKYTPRERRMATQGWHSEGGSDRFLASGGWLSRTQAGVRLISPRRHAVRGEYAVRSGDSELTLEGVTWADWDQAGRFVFARDNRLLAGELHAEAGIVAERELCDFRDMALEPIVAPDWAKEW